MRENIPIIIITGIGSISAISFMELKAFFNENFWGGIFLNKLYKIIYKINIATTTNPGINALI